MSKRATVQTDAGVAVDGSDGSIEQIRSILFGSQMREFEHKLHGLETRMGSSAAQMQQEMLERVAALEGRLAALHAQESEERQMADSGLQNTLDAAVGALEGRLASEVKELRLEARDQGKELSKKVDAVAASLEAAVAELRLQKTDRVLLADLLADLAKRLRKD